MTGIELYSTTAASNNSAVPNGWPEGMAPSGVNDSARQLMAAIRTWYESAEWINLGHTPTYIGATQFSVTTDLTAIYQVGRRIRAVGSTPFTIYGTISASAYASVTTVTVVWDSGSLNGTLTAVSVAMLSITNPSLAVGAVSGITAAARTVLDDTTVAAMVDTLGGATSTGTGGIARSTSPTFVTPLLGTPTSGVLTNCTGLPEAGLTLADNTTANASTSAHGFLKKLSNVATEFMNGAGNWATPASSPLTLSFVSSQQTIAASTVGAVAHGLGVRPKIVNITFICTSTELGYSVGDEVLYASVASDAGRGLQIFLGDTTNVRWVMGSTTRILQKSASDGAIDYTKWKMIIRAYA